MKKMDYTGNTKHHDLDHTPWYCPTLSSFIFICPLCFLQLVFCYDGHQFHMTKTYNHL
jgi:hypothetical protein